jgi:hypothetical protein
MYRVSQEECVRLREGVPYVKVCRYNPKHLCPKLNGYGDNDQRNLKGDKDDKGEISFVCNIGREVG